MWFSFSLWSDYWEIQHNNMKTLFTYSMAITIAICHYFLQLYISSLMLSELIIFVAFFLRNLFNFLVIFTKQFLHDRSSASIPCVFSDLYFKWIISSILYSRTYLSIYLWNVYIYIYIYEIYVFQNSWSTSGFPNHSTIDIWGWTIHCWGAGPWIPKDSAFLRRYGIIRK